MPKQVPIDQARLRAAVADQRYWRASHPERGACRAWVDEGYRALYADDTVSHGKVVHVRAYTRDGHAVAAHTVIGFRPSSARGSPAVDINIPGYATVRKLHF